MRNVLLLAAVCLLLAGSISVPPALAEWGEEGVLLGTSGLYTDRYPVICSDGKGGAIVFWEYDANPFSRLYAQRINAAGEVMWITNGVEISSGNLRLDMTSDDDGGAIMAYNRSGDVYAQRVDSLGNEMWGSSGIPVCTVAISPDQVKILSDGAGGAIVVWEDERVSMGGDIYAQRVDPSGSMLWTTGGVAICTAAEYQMWTSAVPDGSGGAIISWRDGRSTNSIYAQRIDSSGTVQWTVDGDSVCTATGILNYPTIVTDDAGGAIITWEDTRNGTYDIYAQRVEASGIMQWTTDGIAVCSEATTNQFEPSMTADGSGGAIVVWTDWRDGNMNGYAQRINSSGAALWTTDGVSVASESGNETDYYIVTDNNGGAIVSYTDYTSNPNDGASVQRIDENGNLLWGTHGRELAKLTSASREAVMIPSGSGGVIVAYAEHRLGDNSFEMYAQRLNEKGYWLHKSAYISSISDVPDDQGGKMVIRWESSVLENCPNNVIEEYSIWRRLPAEAMKALNEPDEDGILDFHLMDESKIRFIDSAASSYAWEWIATVPSRCFDIYAYTVTSHYDSMGTDPHWQYFMVSAETVGDTMYYDSPVDSGYSVDNLSPCIPAGAAGEQKMSPDGLDISWNANSESDFLTYQVYRGLSEDFVPGSGNLIASPTEPECFDDEWQWDSGYYYKISAKDVHGNESGYVVLVPDDVTGTHTQIISGTSFLGQNYPNPFNPLTMIPFGLKERDHVSLKIYNPVGQLVRNLIEGTFDKGLYEEYWDGMDSNGQAVSSGIYFYRLVVGDFQQTKKMVLLK